VILVAVFVAFFLIATFADKSQTRSTEPVTPTEPIKPMTLEEKMRAVCEQLKDKKVGDLTTREANALRTCADLGF
jgi:hypothetical protein